MASTSPELLTRARANAVGRGWIGCVARKCTFCDAVGKELSNNFCRGTDHQRRCSSHVEKKVCFAYDPSTKQFLEACFVLKKWVKCKPPSRIMEYLLTQAEEARGDEEHKDDICPVCVDDLHPQNTPLECGHRLHASCIVRLAAGRHVLCPMCRAPSDLLSCIHGVATFGAARALSRYILAS